MERPPCDMSTLAEQVRVPRTLPEPCSSIGDISVISQPPTSILEGEPSPARSLSGMRTRLRAAATRRPRCGDGTDALLFRVFMQDTLCVIIV